MRVSMGMFDRSTSSPTDIDRDIVHVETHSGDRYLEEQSSVLEYLRLFDAVSHRALDNDQSRDLLTRLVEAPPQPEEMRLISTDGYTKSQFLRNRRLRRGAHARRRHDRPP